jgi:hypothetical protein
MRRTLTLVAALATMLGMVALPAAAHEEPGTPLHGHMRLLHAEWTGPGVGPGTELISYGKCIDLAGGKALPLQAHHDTVHTGRAGAALRGAGHLTIPTAPLTPFTGCADLAKAFPPR